MLIPLSVLIAAGSVGVMEVLAEDDRKSGPSMSAAAAGEIAQPSAKKGTTIKVERTEFGKALVNRAGRAVYLFDLEDSSVPECYEDCAVAWPPVLTKGKPVAGEGATQGKLGTTTRKDGSRQVTYAGHPLYFYEHDTPDLILCQDVVEFARPLAAGPPQRHRPPLSGPGKKRGPVSRASRKKHSPVEARVLPRYIIPPMSGMPPPGIRRRRRPSRAARRRSPRW